MILCVTVLLFFSEKAVIDCDDGDEYVPPPLLHPWWEDPIIKYTAGGKSNRGCPRNSKLAMKPKAR